jgi:CelD/BcsL family acetyltransferase involved in cellulose biosynthesis
MHGFAALEEFSVEIDRLNAAATRPNPFLSSAFLKAYALQNEYHPPGEERLYLVHDGSALIGCAPLRRCADGAGSALVRLIGWRSIRLGCLAPFDTEYPGILAAPVDQDRVAAALVRHLRDNDREWDLLEFAGQQPGTALHRAVQAADGWRFRARDIEVQPYNVIPLAWNDLAGYFHSLAKKMRSNISRQTRRLFAAGEVELVFADGAGATSAWFDAYRDLDARSWKGGGTASIQRNARRTAFYRDIAAGKAGLDPSFIGVVLDGVLIAGLILGSGMASDGRSAWCLEMAYDRSRADLGPGQLLLLLAVAHAIDGGHTHLSFMQNFSYYKHRWGALPAEVRNVTLARRASLRNAAIAVRELTRKFGRAPQVPAVGQEHEENAAAADSQAQDHARTLTAQALASAHGIRRLDRTAAGAFLPFPLE